VTDEQARDRIHVRVSFPISKKGPYEEEVAPETTVGVVLLSAMRHFEVENDSQFTYVLAHDGHEQAEGVMVGSLAHDTHEVRFTLIKKITQG
jgi:hypothetical protein